jgi:hypothetical protein
MISTEVELLLQIAGPVGIVALVLYAFRDIVEISFTFKFGRRASPPPQVDRRGAD